MAALNPHPLFLREDELRLGVSLLQAASQRLRNAEAELLETHGIGPAQQRILAYLALAADATPSELNRLFQVSKQNLWRLLRPLLARNLIRAAPDPADRRRKRLSLTSEGRAAINTLSEPSLRLLAQAYRGEGADATEGFRRVLAALAPEGWLESVEGTERTERTEGTEGTENAETAETTESAARTERTEAPATPPSPPHAPPRSPAAPPSPHGARRNG